MTGNERLRVSRLVANIAILLAGAGLLYATVGATAGLAVGRRGVATTQYWPSASAQIGQAEQLLKAPGRDVAGVTGIAIDVWRREPLSVGALRLIAATTSAAGDSDRADRIYRLIESQTRRDTFTEMWLVNGAMARNDVDDVLLHADRAMRTSIRNRPYLFQLLSFAAANSPRFRAGIAGLIAARTNYWSDLYDALLLSNNAGAIIPDVLRGARLGLEDDTERRLVQGSISRLIEVQKFDEALAAYVAYFPARRGEALTNGGFERDAPLFQFNWQLGPDADLAADGDGRGGRHDRALNYHAATEGTHLLAQQILLLPAGAYDLSLAFNADTGGTPRMTIACARSAGGAVATVSAARQADDRLAVQFNADPACGYYTLSLWSDGRGSGWIDDVAVTPRGRAAETR